MKRSWCVPAAALLAGISAACAVQTRPLSFPTAARRIPASLRVRMVEAGRTTIREVPLEEYVRATIVSEFAPPSGSPALVGRMLELQAIVGRTYALAHLGRHQRDGFDLCSTTHCQLYEPGRLRTSRWAAAAADATRRTAGVVIWFDRAPAYALFHADCGGHTSDAAAVWGGTPRSYLLSIADDGPAAAAHTTWHYEVTREALRRALNGDARTAAGARLQDVAIVGRDDAGRATSLRIRGDQDRSVRGETFRDVLSRAFGVRSIKSTLFDVRKAGATYVFEGRGFGHGVGLCQTGALARLNAGATPAEVLAHYFPGTRIGGR
jgi:stage II sporulation protein D (peptidoglycan lytic transglycosylase)